MQSHNLFHTFNELFLILGYKQASLSRIAEKALIDAIETQKHRDAVYFWVPMDMDPRSHLRRDFWSFCDAINAGNCK
jgi:hypothetical protein